MITTFVLYREEKGKGKGEVKRNERERGKKNEEKRWMKGRKFVRGERN